MDQSPCKKRWTLWTVWSTELGKMIDTPGVSLKYFTDELLNVVKEKDQTFSYDKKESLYVIQPTPVLEKKASSDGSREVIEIGGTIFKPGSRGEEGGWGQRWRLIAENKLVELFLAEENFNWVNLSKEVFVIINGRVLESANRIWLDDPSHETKIVRLINQPCGDDRYSSVSYDFMNTWFHTGPAQHKLLRTSPYCADISRKSRRASHGRIVPTHPHDIQGGENFVVSRANYENQNTKKSRKRPLEEDLCSKEVLSENNKNSECSIGDHKEDEVDTSSPVKKKIAKTAKRSASPSLKHYEKLKNLQEELRSHHNVNHVLNKRNVYGIVEEVLEVPTEEEIKGLPSKEAKAAAYLLRISDETLRNVLVRLCTIITSKPRTTPPAMVGPAMAPGDIIRIHRATVQFEHHPHPDSPAEMVISSAPHLNYTVFLGTDDVDAEFKYERLAAHTEALKENDYDIIRGLRSFLKSSGLVRHGVSDVDVVQSCNTKSASSPARSKLGSLSSPKSARTRRPKSDDAGAGAENFINTQANVSVDSGRRVTYHDRISDKEVEHIDAINGENEEVQPSEKEGVVLEAEVDNEDDDPGVGSNLIAGSTECRKNDITVANDTEKVDEHSSNFESVVVENTHDVCILPISALTLYDCEQSKHVNLHGRILDYMYIPSDHRILVRVTDSTGATVWLQNLLEYPDNPVKVDEPFFDVEIAEIQSFPNVRKKIMRAVGSSEICVFKDVTIVANSSSESTKLFHLEAKAEAVLF